MCSKKLTRLTIILPTEAKLEDAEKIGLFSRWKVFFNEYAKYFDIEVYSCDTLNYSDKLKVKHYSMPFSLSFIPFGNQIFYNLYIFLKAFAMSHVVRVISASYFVLPLIKFIFRKQIILSYPYDYATSTKKDFGGLKGLTAKIRETLSIKSAALIITTTQELENKIQDRYQRESLIVPNFVETKKFIPLNKEKIILYAGRIYWHKGIEYLIKAFKMIADKNEEYKLVLAGFGETGKYKALSKELGLKRVEFMEAIDNNKMPMLMGRAEIFVLPSLHREGQPKSLIEAMACGCICVATDVPGNNGLIQDNSNGLLVEPKSVDSLFNAFNKIVRDKELGEMLSYNAVKSSEGFSVENTLYKEIAIVKARKIK